MKPYTRLASQGLLCDYTGQRISFVLSFQVSLARLSFRPLFGLSVKAL